jgi:hypothetical protein
MKRFACLLFLAALSALSAPTSDFAGHWRVTYAGPAGTAPKTVGSIVPDLTAEATGVGGTGVSGVVKIGPRPGAAPVAEAKLDGEHLVFLATGTLSSTTGVPACKVDATIHGDQMVLLLSVVKNAGGPLGADQVYEYRGTRTKA